MSMKRKWLRMVFLVMMALATFGGSPVNPKEIEDLLHVMNEAKIEFTIPDENHKGRGKLEGTEIEAGSPREFRTPETTRTSTKHPSE
jgi:hypothetical protein